MTDTANGWPARPGVPLNPEKDGWHWLYRDGEGSDCALWLARSRCWQLVGTEEFFEAYEMVVRRWRYLGPVLTFDEASALQKRVVELEGALRNARARYIELSDKDAAEAMAEIINEALGDVK